MPGLEWIVPCGEAKAHEANGKKEVDSEAAREKWVCNKCRVRKEESNSKAKEPIKAKKPLLLDHNKEKDLLG